MPDRKFKRGITMMVIILAITGFIAYRQISRLSAVEKPAPAAQP